MLQQELVQPNITQSTLAFHETMEIHELLNLKTVCMTKSKMMSGIVFDQDLKSLLEKDVNQSVIQIEQLKSLYQRGPQSQDRR